MREVEREREIGETVRQMVNMIKIMRMMIPRLQRGLMAEV